MVSLNEFPKIMAEAREDLAGNVAGRFSPEDWDSILGEARNRFAKHKLETGDDLAAWRAVILEFNREKFWGFRPDWRPPPKKRDETKLGARVVWMVFSAFVVTKIAVVWLGQIYTASDDPKDKYLFFGAIALAVSNFVFFLWKTRKYKD